MLKSGIPAQVRINEAWEVGFNEIVDFAPFVEGTRESVCSRLLCYRCSAGVVPVQYLVFQNVFRRFIFSDFHQASISKLTVTQGHSISKSKARFVSFFIKFLSCVCVVHLRTLSTFLYVYVLDV